MPAWRRARSFFPITESAVYLDHAGAAPLSSRVDEALRRFATDATRARHAALEEEVERARGRIAVLLGADAPEITFVPNAARGLALVAGDVDWRPGDRMALVGDRPEWSPLRVPGVEALRVPLALGQLPPGALEEAVQHPRTRLLAVASVDAATGTRIPLAAIGRLCREHGVRLCVDASHSAGCLDVDVAEHLIDDLVTDAHRWLLGLSGTGILFRRRHASWDTDPAPRVFEEGAHNEIGIAALGAAVDLLLETGMGEIEGRVLQLTEHLVKRLDAIAVTIQSPRARLASGIVSFRVDGEAPSRTAQRLERRGIRVGASAGAVRASPHFYNDEAEIDALVDALIAR